MNSNANPLERAATHVLEFLLGNQPRTVLISAIDAANGVVMEEIGEDTGWMRGLTAAGNDIAIRFTDILKIEEYKVTGNWGGNGNKTVKMTGDQIADYTRNRGGEAKEISQVKDSKGNVIFDKYDGKNL